VLEPVFKVGPDNALTIHVDFKFPIMRLSRNFLIDSFKHGLV